MSVFLALLAMRKLPDVGKKMEQVLGMGVRSIVKSNSQCHNPPQKAASLCLAVGQP